MGRNDLCFCGSEKKHKNCHKHVNEDSIVASLYGLYSEINQEIKKQKTEKNYEFKCSGGCSECCHQCFYISEAEMILILDYMSNNFSKGETDEIIDKALNQWEILEKSNKAYANTLMQNMTGAINQFNYRKLFKDKPDILPFPCVLLDDKTNLCKVYEVRPFICRTHGTGYINNEENIICSKLPSLYEVKKDLVDLTRFNKSFEELFLFHSKRNNSLFIRRPFPIFYFIKFFFDDGLSIEDFLLSKMFFKLTSISRETYIANEIASR